MANPLPKATACLIAFWAAAPALTNAAPIWNEATAPAVSTTNCITGATETLSTSSVAWFGDPLAPPALNTVYYARVRWFVTGKPCIGGARVAPELFLPDGSTLAISAANPVKCFAVNINTGVPTQELAACPQAAAVGARGGLGFYPLGPFSGTWPTAQGFGWEIHVPMLSTARLNGVVTSLDPMTPCADCLTAAVWSIDGVLSPWAFPRVGVRTAGGAAVPTITYPVPSATSITNTGATGTILLARAGTTGSAYIEDALTPPSGSTCTQSSNLFPITAGDPAVRTLTATFTQLPVGTDHYWRLCYITGGRTYWGATQVFRTTGTAPPRIFSLSPDIALPGRDVVITGADLAGAMSVTINGGPGPVAAAIKTVSPNAVTFVVPDVTSLVGTVSITTPGGTSTTIASGLTVGIDTILDSVTIAATTGGALLNDVTVRYHSTEPFPSAQYECILDGGPFARSCDAGVVFYDDLAPGLHSLQITARASGWRDLFPLVVPFEIVNSDTTPPDTTLLTGPQGFINTTSATFTFSASETGATFECSGDNPPNLWVPCASPYTWTGIPQGFHLFDVRAKDAAQNVDSTPARTSFWVDTIPPNTTLLSLVPAPGSATTTSATALFVFLSAAGSRFQCSLDAAPFSACPTPARFTGLARTAHTLRVRAVDRAGNVDATPATRTWTIVP